MTCILSNNQMIGSNDNIALALFGGPVLTYFFEGCHPIGFFIYYFSTHNYLLRQRIKLSKMPQAGFEPQTLGAASSHEDHFSMPLPLVLYFLFLVKQTSILFLRPEVNNIGI